MPDPRPRFLLIASAALVGLTVLAVLAAEAGLSLGAGTPLKGAVLAEIASAPARASDDPLPKAFVWSATHIGTTLKLRGFVPSEEDRRTLLGMVKAHFPDLEVEDRLKVTGGAPTNEQWLGAVSFGLKQLSHLKQGSARLLNTGLKVEGEARSADDYAEVKKALSGPLPAGLSVLNDNVRPPVANPFVFAASLDPNSLTLTGKVPSEDQRKQLKDLARRLFERPMLDDQLDLASGAPKNWRGAAEASLRALSRLDSGKVSLSGPTLAIEGVASDKMTAADVSSQLKRDLPAHFSSTANIRWKEADISHNVELLAPPREDDEAGITTGAVKRP